MPLNPAISHVISLTSLAFLSSNVSATIAPCNSTICPSNDKGDLTCKYDNMTAAGVGISSFNTSLSPSLLTWTVAVQKPSDRNSTFQRDYLLGAPDALKLQQTSPQDKQACALFFEGVSSKLKFPGNDPRFDQGSCYTALGTKCGLGLQFLAFAELNNILQNVTDTSPETVCSKLGESLRSRPPGACNGTVGPDWGNIIAKPLTGGNVSHTLNATDCHPTTQKDYNVSVVASSQVSIPKNSTDLPSALYGVTPILTVVYGEKLQDPELDFTCIKVIDTPGKHGLGLGDKVGAALSKNDVNTLLAVGLALVSVVVGGLLG